MYRVFPSLSDIFIKKDPNRQNSVTVVTEFSNKNDPSSPPEKCFSNAKWFLDGSVAL